MKVALFCGGYGTRLREYSETIPKPLATIGSRPIIWHLMKYYAHYGHNDFVLCLGYKGEMIKEYFLKYDEWLSNDFELSAGGSKVDLFSSDTDDWRIKFIDTGLKSNIGMRLLAVKKYFENEDIFLANYSDGLSNFPLDEYLEKFKATDAIASFVSVRPSQSFHAVTSDKDGFVTAIEDVGHANYWINGGFFILRKEIFDYMRPGEELVVDPFLRLLKERKLIAYNYTGFWAAMDTFKDKMKFDKMEESGDWKWKVWEKQ
ncbi:MAG: glucose-1-phosphate cytidylyltransferase [Gammaproteobacteria bacterium]|nr:glucose-1-phosphate cytidylyltransferase [Gammaproteobacteria bacterium]